MDKSQVRETYRQMLLIRRFEEASSRLYMQGKIRGFLHLYIGQEAVAVGAIPALNADDYVISHYRDHGHALARGMDPKVVMAELFGKATGSSGGKGGSMHLFDSTRNFMGGYAIVGGQLPIAVGLALAIKYRKESRVVLCFFGDGAVSEGEFHESLNLASLWKLPVVFFLENNLYGMGTSVERTHAGGKDIYLTAEPYKIPAAQIDGMDLMAVREGTTEALARVRADTGPIFLEAMTYRFRGHSLADPEEYRNDSEVAEWLGKDPIALFKQRSIKDGLLAEVEIAEIGEEVEGAVREAVEFAEASPVPSLDTIFDNVYGSGA
ncbi:MAG: pyruvate dehydrogenase (acetyl-transferring) E1 component subunit alpha, partial [Chloroflexi bacterium]|nr:pyruvate dehydrogenase (acetyl-transferring) E1 component subunit alpha [Chloroflexota bacterium]